MDQSLFKEHACLSFRPDVIDDRIWFKQFKRDFGRCAAGASRKPAPVPWFVYYWYNLRWPRVANDNGNDDDDDDCDAHIKGVLAWEPESSGASWSVAGSRVRWARRRPACTLATVLQFCTQVRRIHQKCAADSLTGVQELLLEGDLETAAYQIDRELSRHNSEYQLSREKSALQFAALGRSAPALEFMVSRGAGDAQLSAGDVVSGFTPLHTAVVCGAADCCQFLLLNGAQFPCRDKVGATPIDYARLLGFLPSRQRLPGPGQGPLCLVAEPEQAGRLAWADQAQFARLFPGVTYCPETLGSHEYVLELMFSGISIEKRDTRFRTTHLPVLLKDWGDDYQPDARLFLAHTGDERVGWGLFAAQPFARGELICAYGGQLRSADHVTDRAYAVGSGVDGVVLDARQYRSLAGFANHCGNGRANAELQGAHEAGAERVALIATRDIEPGHQIAFDYESSFFDNGDGEGDREATTAGGDDQGDDDVWGSDSEQGDLVVHQEESEAGALDATPKSGLSMEQVVDIDPEAKFAFIPVLPSQKQL